MVKSIFFLLFILKCVIILLIVINFNIVAKDIYNIYRNFFDIHIKNSTIVVGLISLLIIFIWVYIPNNSNLYTKSNILESNNVSNFSWKIVIIDWIEYRLYLK